MLEEDKFKNYISTVFDMLERKMLKQVKKTCGGDPLANYRFAARMAYCDDSYEGMYEVAKDYLRGYLSYIYVNDINGEEVAKNLDDIVQTCIVMRFMFTENLTQKMAAEYAKEREKNE